MIKNNLKHYGIRQIFGEEKKLKLKKDRRRQNRGWYFDEKPTKQSKKIDAGWVNWLSWRYYLGVVGFSLATPEITSVNLQGGRAWGSGWNIKSELANCNKKKPEKNLTNKGWMKNREAELYFEARNGCGDARSGPRKDWRVAVLGEAEKRKSRIFAADRFWRLAMLLTLKHYAEYSALKISEKKSCSKIWIWLTLMKVKIAMMYFINLDQANREIQQLLSWRLTKFSDDIQCFRKKLNNYFEYRKNFEIVSTFKSVISPEKGGCQRKQRRNNKN